jgi:hypothetical protein
MSLNPAVGTQPGKLSALRGLLDCTDDAESTDTDTQDGADTADEADAPAITRHPLRFAVDAAGPAERYNAGIVLGAFVLLAGVAALVAGVVAPVRLLVARSVEKNAGYAYGDALSWSRFPGLLSLPLVLVLPGAAEAGAAALSSRAASTTPVARAIGAIGVVMCVAVPVLLACAFRLRFRRLFVWSIAGEGTDAGGPAAGPGRPVTASRLVKKQLSRRVDALVLVEDKEWCAAPSAFMADAAETDAERTHTLLRHFGMFFDVYRGKAPWFLTVELFFVVATSIASGLHKATGCSALAWTLAVLYSALAVAFAVIRPHAVRLDRVLYGLLSFAQAAAVLGAAAIELTNAHGGDSTHATRARTGASFFLSAVSMSAGAVGVYELGKVMYQQVKAHRAKQRATQRAADGTRDAPPLEAGLLDMDRLEALELERDAAFPPDVERSAAAPPAQHLPPADFDHHGPSDQPEHQPQTSPAAEGLDFDLDAFLAEDRNTAADARDAGRQCGEEQRLLLMDILGGDGADARTGTHHDPMDGDDDGGDHGRVDAELGDASAASRRRQRAAIATAADELRAR